MILFENQRIAFGDVITPKKIDGFLILYATPTKGKIESYLMVCSKVEQPVSPIYDDGGNEIAPESTQVSYQAQYALEGANKVFDDSFFEGNILEELHLIYLEELANHNPETVFINTLKRE